MTTIDGNCSNLDAIAWYVKNSNNTTHPVGLKLPNAWGIYDMLGNVWEWCSDGYNNDYLNCTVTDPRYKKGNERILRGGSWNFPAKCCRSANRYYQYINTDRRSDNIGFRVALVPID